MKNYYNIAVNYDEKTAKKRMAFIVFYLLEYS